MHLDAKYMSCVILPFDVVCMGSPAIITLQRTQQQLEEKVGILQFGYF